MARFFTSVCLTFIFAGAVTATSGEELPDLIFVQIPKQAQPATKPGDRIFTPLDRYVDGARIVILRQSGGELVNLTPEFSAACDPDVSFDGQSIVFAGKRSPQAHWQIWKMNIDGSQKVQITRSKGACYAPVHAGNRFYLNDAQPTPQIIYVSSAHGWKNKQRTNSTLALYGTDTEGQTVHRLTFNLGSDFSPDILPNGRIVFTSIQNFGNRFQPTGIFALMGINNDGTDLMPFYGNHEKPLVKDMVHVSDFGDRIYFIESAQTNWLGGGNIAFVSRERPLHSYHRLSHESMGIFHSPCTLPDGGLVASYRTKLANALFSIYSINPETGVRQKQIFTEPGWHCIDVQVSKSHPKVLGRSNWLIPGATTGVFYCLNSYRTNLPQENSIAHGAIKHVRVIEGLPLTHNVESKNQHKATNDQNSQNYSATAFGPRRILGVAPVENDGSFHIRVPAEIPITFQLLDENYLALRSQNAWTWVMGNENRGCIGCHEDREMAPPNKMVDAIIKPPVELILPPSQRRTVDFRHQIAPIVQSKCAVSGCHDAGNAEPNLEEDKNTTASTAFSKAYEILINPIQSKKNKRYLIPGNARKSPIIWHLFGKRRDSEQTPSAGSINVIPPQNTLNSRERLLFIEWIDLGAQWDSRSAMAAESQMNEVKKK